MPRNEIDYSNTIIYKIICRDENCKDIYVGHTTNFVERKYAHIRSCNNSKAKNHNCKLYKAIRNNGGWDNWNMEIVNFYKCKDSYEARQKEQEHFISLNATLNSNEPFSKQNALTLHSIKTNANVNNLITEDNVSDPDTIIRHKLFECIKCEYSCKKQSDFNKHLITRKHQGKHSLQKNYLNNYECSCGKKYKFRQGLSVHKKKCNKGDYSDCNNNNNTNDNKQIIDFIIKENTEIKNIMLDVIKSNTELQQQLLDICKQ